MSSKLFLAAIVLASLSLTLVPAQKEVQEEAILEPRKADEIEYENAQQEDDNFDTSVLYEEEKPQDDPVQEKVEQEYHQFLESSRVQYEEKADKVDLYYHYLTKPLWYNPYYPCCPRSQYYDCRSVQQRLPCFYSKGQWCCPFWPTVYIANCNCGTCVRQCPASKCFANGKCNRRYSLRSFWAVCWNGWWGMFRYFKMYLPTSCYCNAQC